MKPTARSSMYWSFSWSAPMAGCDINTSPQRFIRRESPPISSTPLAVAALHRIGLASPGVGSKRKYNRGVELDSRVSIEADYCSWLQEQASILRRLRSSALDWENLAE